MNANGFELGSIKGRFSPSVGTSSKNSFITESGKVIVLTDDDINVIASQATNFDVRVTKEQALAILQGRFDVMCKEYGEDEDWVGVTIDDLETLKGDEYKTFELWAI
jgi:hypothetical protein